MQTIALPVGCIEVDAVVGRLSLEVYALRRVLYLGTVVELSDDEDVDESEHWISLCSFSHYGSSYLREDACKMWIRFHDVLLRKRADG